MSASRDRGGLVALVLGAGLVAFGLARAPVGLYTPWTPADVDAPTATLPAPRLWLCLGGTPNELRDLLDVPGDTLYTCRDGRVEPIRDERSVVRWVAPAAPGIGNGPTSCPETACPPTETGP